MLIPRVIHQIWFQGQNVNIKKYKDCQKSCKKIYQNWDYILWDKKKIETMIKRDYPQYWKLYNIYPFMIQKIDIAKIFIMHRYGGVYMDMDMECLKEIDTKIINKNDDIVFSKFPAFCDHNNFCFPIVLASMGRLYNHPFLSTGFYASKPKHPFWIGLLNCFDKNKENKWYYFNNKPLYTANSTSNGIVSKYIRDEWIGKVKILDPKYLEPCSTRNDCNITKDAYAKDHLGNSWVNENERNFFHLTQFIMNKKKRFIERLQTLWKYIKNSPSHIRENFYKNIIFLTKKFNLLIKKLINLINYENKLYYILIIPIIILIYSIIYKYIKVK